MTTELDDAPALDEAPPQWPPVAHLVEKRQPIREGMIALCGERLMGIPLDDAQAVCEECVEIARRRLGL